MTTATTTEPTPGWVVAVLGVLLLPLAAGAFILSFVQLLPVMLFGGWDTSTAWLGPVVLDVTAAAGAVMHVVSRDKQVRGWGLGLLAGATALSVAGNLAGHAIRTADGRPRVSMPEHMAGWALPAAGQYVVTALSVAVPVAVAVLVHAFGAVLTAWLSTRPVAASESGRPDSLHPTRPDSALADHPTPVAVATRPDPTPGPDSLPTGRSARPDSASESAPDSVPTDPTRLTPDSTADLRESDESGARPDPVDHPTPDPTGDPTEVGVGYPTDPTATRPDSPNRPDASPDSDPTESGHPTPDPTIRPDSESDADPTATDPELARLVAEARTRLAAGEIRLTADSIRPALRVGQARAKQIRDILKHERDRHGLRAVS